MQEISFNSSLMREMRTIAFVTKLIDDGKMASGKRMFIHLIEAEDLISDLSGSSKMNGTWKFLDISSRDWPSACGHLAGVQFRPHRRRVERRSRCQILLMHP